MEINFVGGILNLECAIKNSLGFYFILQKYTVFDADNLYVHWIKNLYYQWFVLRWICSLFWWMIFWCNINSVSSIANPRLYYCFHDSSWLENERELLVKPYIYQKKTCKQEKACAFNRCLYLSKKQADGFLGLTYSVR